MRVSWRSTSEAVSAFREALLKEEGVEDALGCISHWAEEIDPVTSVDLLERAAAAGNLDAVKALYEIFPFFVYQTFALVLAMRCGHEDVARWLIDEKDVDLLANINKPTNVRMMLPPNTTFTRSGLTRLSTYLFLNPQDPTMSTYVFEPFSGYETLDGPDYEYPFDIEVTCDIVRRMSKDNLFDATVFDDLFRAIMMRGWRCLRHADSRDEATAEICFSLGWDMIQMHRELGYGDERMADLLGSFIVPRGPVEMIEFICEHAPYIFYEKLTELSWLQAEHETVSQMVDILVPGTDEQNELLLTIVAANNYLDKIKVMQAWDCDLTKSAYDAAIIAASDEGHPEVATYLLTSKQDSFGAATDNNDNESCDTDDLLSGLLL